MSITIYKSIAKGRFTKALGVLFILATLALVFCAGGYLGQATLEPKAVIDHEIRTVPQVIERVEFQPVEKIVVERIETYQPLRHFRNLDELEGWVRNIGVLDIRFDVVNEETSQRIKKFDCEDYAIRLQEKALSDGYIMSFEVIHSAEYNALFKQKQIPSGAIHAINSVILENEVYYIEPQTCEIVPVAYLD